MSMLIVGDLILDRYWFGTSSRLSPEAPVPVVDEVSEEWRLGGAANVARQLRVLGEDVVLAGVIGQDAAGERLRAMLAAEGIDTVLVSDPRRPTTLKHRIVANDHQIARVDAESRASLDKADTMHLLCRLADVLPQADAVVLSDYSKGVLCNLVTRGVIDSLGGAAPVVVDTKAMELARYARATVLTPNEMELRRATGHGDLADAARTALGELDGGAVLVTQGARGMTLWRPDLDPVHLHATARHVADVTGAGDTVTGILAWGLAQGLPLERAAALANAAAGVTVAEMGNGLITKDELALLGAPVPAQLPAQRQPAEMSLPVGAPAGS
jgi:D-beta-D-heptose 7-phosphate kinase/D-beta-D-heptose 1-phosphate adenosyltransferase